VQVARGTGVPPPALIGASAAVRPSSKAKNASGRAKRAREENFFPAATNWVVSCSRCMPRERRETPLGHSFTRTANPREKQQHATVAGHHHELTQTETGSEVDLRERASPNQALVRHEVADETAVLRVICWHSLLFCQEFPTAACVASNVGVRSPRDNVASALGLAAEARADTATASSKAVGSQECTDLWESQGATPGPTRRRRRLRYNGRHTLALSRVIGCGSPGSLGAR
jgi:hypothetical protein